MNYEGTADAAATDHPAEAEPAEPELHAARELRDQLAAAVRDHVEAGCISPHAAAEACKALAAEAIAELAGGGDMGLGTAGHVLRRFGEDLGAESAANVARATQPPRGDRKARPSAQPHGRLDDAAAMSRAVSDIAEQLARGGVDPDLVSATALASAAALIHQQHGPEGLAERLRAFLKEVEPIAAPAAGRA